MRTTLMVSLLALSLGLTITCLLIIRYSIGRQIQRGLDADITHSLNTFQNETDQRNRMLSREAALLADLPSLKALMSTQDRKTIQDAAGDFWVTSGSDFFALSAADGRILAAMNRGPSLDQAAVERRLEECMRSNQDICLVGFGDRLYELANQSVYFGPAERGSRLGEVTIGYAVDEDVARQISDVATAEAVFLVDNKISASTLTDGRQVDLRKKSSALAAMTGRPVSLTLDGERYTAAGISLNASAGHPAQLVVLKSYDRASLYLRQVNESIVILGMCALCIGLLLAVAISRTVTRPVEDLVAGTRALGRGDFNFPFTSEGAVEVRELSLSFERMRGELQRTQSELLEADRLATIGRMASSISHDLRHHLSAIYANAEFMSLARTSEPERVELLLEVKEAVRDMTDLIESLLLFSQTGQVLQRQNEPLAHIIERTVHSVRQHPECRQVSVNASGLTYLEAWVDGAKLSRAIYNLILNACQASRKGPTLPAVTITLSEDEERIRISVADTGIGVPGAIADTLFKPFVSFGKVNGTGLGLTVAQHIAQEHGGEVKLEETSAKGTTFSILLYKSALARPEARSRSRSEGDASGPEGALDRKLEPTQENL